MCRSKVCYSMPTNTISSLKGLHGSEEVIFDYINKKQVTEHTTLELILCKTETLEVYHQYRQNFTCKIC